MEIKLDKHSAAKTVETCNALLASEPPVAGSANGSEARWWSGAPMTNADVWECALAEGWKPGTGNSVRDAVAFLAKHGHKLYEITPPNDPSSVTRRPGADDNQKPL